MTKQQIEHRETTEPPFALLPQEIRLCRGGCGVRAVLNENRLCPDCERQRKDALFVDECCGMALGTDEDNRRNLQAIIDSARLLRK